MTTTLSCTYVLVSTILGLGIRDGGLSLGCLKHAKDGKVQHEVLEDWGLVVLQGPSTQSNVKDTQTFGSTGLKSTEYLQNPTSCDLSKFITFGKSACVPIGTINLHVAQGVYRRRRFQSKNIILHMFRFF